MRKYSLPNASSFQNVDLVKVFLRSIEKDGKRIEFDPNKITVSVSGPIQYDPVIKLHRWTKDEIFEYTQKSSNRITVSASSPIQYDPIIKLQRLTKAEIFKYTQKTSKNEAEISVARDENWNLEDSSVHTFPNAKPSKQIGSKGQFSDKTNGQKKTKRKSVVVIDDINTRSKKRKIESIMPQKERLPCTLVKMTRPFGKQNLNEKKNMVCESKDENHQMFKMPRIEQPPPTHTVSKLQFTIGETVWAKIKGSPHWPARIV